MKKILSIIISIMLVVGMSISFSGCKRSWEDCIPETLGKTEGFYLYYDNYRSLTDGTQQEKLLAGEIVVDGITYTEDEYFVYDLSYMTSKKEIFYSLETSREGEEPKYFLWHYNYDTKESGWVYTFDGEMYLQASDTYVLAQSSPNNNDKEGFLFDGNLNFVTDGLYKYFLGSDRLFKLNYSEFLWWKNGNFFSVKTSERLDHLNTAFLNECAYLFMQNSVYTVNLDTGNFTISNLPADEKFLDTATDYGMTVKGADESVYFITYTTLTETEYESSPIKTECSLWTIKDTELKKVYKFPKKYEVRFGGDYNEKYINLSLKYVLKLFNLIGTNHRSGYYVMQKKKMISGFSKTITHPTETLIVGEYEFYIDYVTYGGYFAKYCYYLHRIHNGKDEILQYHFNNPDDREPKSIFFDDIHIR